MSNDTPMQPLDRCQLPYCPMPVDGTSWIDTPPVDGVPVRLGFCCPEHARTVDGYLVGLPHTLVLGQAAADEAEGGTA